jgi:endoglucanase
MAVVFLLAALLTASAAAAPPDSIRTGGPSAPADSKVVLVGASRSQAGNAFTVVDAKGKRVLTGKLTKAKGSPQPWATAAQGDLSRLAKPGSYRIKVGKLTSRPWIVRSDARAAMIKRLLKMFAYERDGNEPNPLFGPAHLNDAIIADGPYAGQRFDLTGGWRDAGDQLKFVQTAGMSVVYLTIAARLAPEVAAQLNAEAGIGARWLRKMHQRPDLFVVQVGDERDHGTGFRDPANDDALGGDGVGKRFAYPSTGSNTAGRAAAALAIASTTATPTDKPILIGDARDWYDAGKAANTPTVVRGGFYQSDDFADDMALGAIELWRATGETRYLEDAKTYLGQAAVDGGLDSFSVGPLAAAEMCGKLGAPAPPDAAARTLGCSKVAEAASASRDRLGTLAFGTPGSITFGSIQDTAGSGVMALAEGGASGRRIAAGARDFITGRNQWGASFIVGRGANEARNPHHSAYLKGTPSVVLDGALEGGPATASNLAENGLPKAGGKYARFNSPAAIYEDKREDFVTCEVGLGYSASAILLAATLR